jgi:hypothetical protein
MERSLDRPSLSGSKSDARWQQWIAKGQARDARTRYRVRTLAISIASLVALALAVALTLG